MSLIELDRKILEKAEARQSPRDLVLKGHDVLNIFKKVRLFQEIGHLTSDEPPKLTASGRQLLDYMRAGEKA